MKYSKKVILVLIVSVGLLGVSESFAMGGRGGGILGAFISMTQGIVKGIIQLAAELTGTNLDAKVNLSPTALHTSITQLIVISDAVYAGTYDRSSAANFMTLGGAPESCRTIGLPFCSK